jgi:hypothetical protein
MTSGAGYDYGGRATDALPCLGRCIPSPNLGHKCIVTDTQSKCVGLFGRGFPALFIIRPIRTLVVCLRRTTGGALMDQFVSEPCPRGSLKPLRSHSDDVRLVVGKAGYDVASASLSCNRWCVRSAAVVATHTPSQCWRAATTLIRPCRSRLTSRSRRTWSRTTPSLKGTTRRRCRCYSDPRHHALHADR